MSLISTVRWVGPGGNPAGSVVLVFSVLFRAAIWQWEPILRQSLLPPPTFPPCTAGGQARKTRAKKVQRNKTEKRPPASPHAQTHAHPRTLFAGPLFRHSNFAHPCVPTVPMQPLLANPSLAREKSSKSKQSVRSERRKGGKRRRRRGKGCRGWHFLLFFPSRTIHYRGTTAEPFLLLLLLFLSPCFPLFLPLPPPGGYQVRPPSVHPSVGPSLGGGGGGLASSGHWFASPPPPLLCALPWLCPPPSWG